MLLRLFLSRLWSPSFPVHQGVDFNCLHNLLQCDNHFNGLPTDHYPYPTIVVAGSTTTFSGVPVDGCHHLGSSGTSLSQSSWLICSQAMIIACMASICLLALLPMLHPAKAVWPHSNASLIWWMVIPSPVKSLATSSMVTLSDSCASIMHGIISIVRCNLSTRCQYNPSVDNNCATWVRNTFLVWHAVTLHGALEWPLTGPWWMTGWSHTGV